MKKIAFFALILLIIAALRKRGFAESAIIYTGPPAWRGKPGEVVKTPDGVTWGWTEAPEVGLPGQWLRILD